MNGKADVVKALLQAGKLIVVDQFLMQYMMLTLMPTMAVLLLSPMNLCTQNTKYVLKHVIYYHRSVTNLSALVINVSREKMY